VQIVALNPVLLRAALPDLLLRPGLSLFGHVTERHGNLGLLMLAGAPVVAELPPDIDAGARLRLRVTEATVDRITLAILPDAPAPTQSTTSPQPPIAFALPGGSHVQLQVQPDDEPDTGGRGARDGVRVTVRLDSAELGRLTLRLDMRSCAVHVTAGEPHRIVQEAAGELGRVLADVTGHPLLVTVHPVEGSVDLRA